MGFLPLNFLWERWANVASKEKILKAENETGKDLILETAFTTAKSYLEFHYTSELYQKYRRLQKDLSKITQNATNRINSGDISEYEYKRISLAAIKLENILSTTSIELRSKVNELKLVSGIDVDNIRTVKPIYRRLDGIDIKSLTNQAIQNRSDLKSSLLQLAAADKSIDYEKSKIIPEISFGIGYKKVEPEVKGMVFQFEFSLPLFKRNQHGIEISELTKRRFEAEYSLKVNKIKNEVAEAGKKVIVYQEQYESLLKIFDEELFTTASFSYEKGELTLVEFIDAISAYLDALNLKTSSEKNYLISIYELNRKIGLIGSKQ
jgi:cobalt-zinc-cadmium efflux system outer membrane protein